MFLKYTSVRNTTLAAAAALTLLAGPSGADEQPRLTVTYISDAAEGRSIDRQDYDNAVAQLKDTERSGIAGFFVANNLCVSYLKTGDTNKAQKSCEAAVANIQDELENNHHVRRDDVRLEVYEKYLALALSNRGVTYVVNDLHEEARADFDAAIEIRAGLRQPRINLARLEELVATYAGLM